MTREPASQSLREMADDVLDLLVGGGAVLMPAFLLAVPCIVLLVVPVLLAGAVFAVVGAILLGPPYLLFRGARRLARTQPRR